MCCLSTTHSFLPRLRTKEPPQPNSAPTTKKQHKQHTKKTNNKIKWHNIFELPKKIVLHFWFERFFPKFFPFALRDLRFRWWIVTTGSSSGTVSVTLHGVPRLQHRFSFLGIRRGRLQLRLLHRRDLRSDLRSDLLAVATCWGVKRLMVQKSGDHQLIRSLSHYLPGFINILSGCLGFLPLTVLS